MGEDITRSLFPQLIDLVYMIDKTIQNYFLTHLEEPSDMDNKLLNRWHKTRPTKTN